MIQAQDTSHVASAISQSVGKVLDVLGEKFGATGAHLWHVLVRQQVVTAVLTEIVGVFLVATAVSLLIAARRLKKSDVYGEEWIFCMAAGIVVAIASVLVIVLNAGGLVNPEFYALRDVTAILR